MRYAGDPIERCCPFCHKPRAMAVLAGESVIPPDVRPAPDGLCWSDAWRSKVEKKEEAK
jgi:hypothetical protein